MVGAEEDCAIHQLDGQVPQALVRRRRQRAEDATLDCSQNEAPHSANHEWRPRRDGGMREEGNG